MTSSKKKTSNGGAIAGAIIGSLVAIAIIGGLYKLHKDRLSEAPRRRRQFANDNVPSSDDQPDDPEKQQDYENATGDFEPRPLKITGGTTTTMNDACVVVALAGRCTQALQLVPPACVCECKAFGIHLGGTDCVTSSVTDDGGNTQPRAARCSKWPRYTV